MAPATLWDRPLYRTHEDAHKVGERDNVVVWVGLDAHAVHSLLYGDSCIETAVLARLRDMLDSEEFSIEQEYRVTATVQVSCSVSETVEAQSEDQAADKLTDMIADGEISSLFDDFTIDDSNIEDVELA
jgi:hypothetical protein